MVPLELSERGGSALSDTYGDDSRSAGRFVFSGPG